MAVSEPATRPEVVQAPRGACSFARAPKGPCPFWFWGIPLAWLTTALVLLGGEIGKSAVFVLWFILAWKHLSRVNASRLVVWLTALALPMHGYAAVAIDLRGPAHYHGAATESGQRHAHGGVERHFHAQGEPAIEVDDGDRNHESKATGTGKNGSPGGFDTQSPAHFPVPAPRPAAVIAAGVFKAAALPFPGRVERPPARAARPRFR